MEDFKCRRTDTVERMVKIINLYKDLGSSLEANDIANILPELFFKDVTPPTYEERVEKWNAWPVKWNVTAFNIPYRSDRARAISITYWTELWPFVVEELGPSEAYETLIELDGMDANWVTGIMLMALSQPDPRRWFGWMRAKGALGLGLNSFLAFSKILDQEIKQSPNTVVDQIGGPYTEKNIGRYLQGISGTVGYAIDLPEDQSPLWDADAWTKNPADLRFYRGDWESVFWEVWEEQFTPRREENNAWKAKIGLEEYLTDYVPTTSGTSRGTKITAEDVSEKLRVTKAIIPQLYTPEELLGIASEPTIEMTALVKPEIGKQRIAVNASDGQFYSSGFFFDTRLAWMKHPKNSTLAESWVEKFTRISYCIKSTRSWLPWDFKEFDYQPSLAFILLMWKWWQAKAIKNEDTFRVDKITNRQYSNMWYDWRTPNGEKHRKKVEAGLGSGLRITSYLGLGYNRANTYAIDKDLKAIVPSYKGITWSRDQGDDLEAEWEETYEAALWYVWALECGVRGNSAKMWLGKGRTEMLRETAIWDPQNREFCYNGIVSRALASCLQRKPRDRKSVV